MGNVFKALYCEHKDEIDMKASEEDVSTLDAIFNFIQEFSLA